VRKGEKRELLPAAIVIGTGRTGILCTAQGEWLAAARRREDER